MMNPEELPLWAWILISLLIGAMLGGFLQAFGEDMYHSLKDWVTSSFGKPKLTNATLKEQTITLYEDIVQFTGEREANRPQIEFDDWEESTENYTKYSQETMNLYHENFGPRVVETREEYLKRGITNDRVEQFYLHPTNPLGIHELAYGLAELASKIEVD